MRGLLHVGRRITLAGFFVFASILTSGCPTKIQPSVPPCPQWNQEILADYERLLEAEENGKVHPELSRLHDYLERQVTFCVALDAARGENNL